MDRHLHSLVHFSQVSTFQKRLGTTWCNSRGAARILRLLCKLAPDFQLITTQWWITIWKICTQTAPCQRTPPAPVRTRPQRKRWSVWKHVHTVRWRGWTRSAGGDKAQSLNYASVSRDQGVPGYPGTNEVLNVWSEAVFSWGFVLLCWMAEVEKSVKLWMLSWL